MEMKIKIKLKMMKMMKMMIQMMMMMMMMMMIMMMMMVKIAMSMLMIIMIVVMIISLSQPFSASNPIEPTAVPTSVPMPHAWAQAAYSPANEGTIVLCSNGTKKYYARVYEKARAAEDMLDADGASNVLSDLGTIHGEEIGHPTYAGGLPFLVPGHVQLLAMVWARWSAMSASRARFR